MFTYEATFSLTNININIARNTSSQDSIISIELPSPHPIYQVYYSNSNDTFFTSHPPPLPPLQIQQPHMLNIRTIQRAPNLIPLRIPLRLRKIKILLHILKRRKQHKLLLPIRRINPPPAIHFALGKVVLQIALAGLIRGLEVGLLPVLDVVLREAQHVVTAQRFGFVGGRDGQRQVGVRYVGVESPLRRHVAEQAADGGHVLRAGGELVDVLVDGRPFAEEVDGRGGLDLLVEVEAVARVVLHDGFGVGEFGAERGVIDGHVCREDEEGEFRDGHLGCVCLGTGLGERGLVGVMDWLGLHVVLYISSGRSEIVMSRSP
jgi:hypothetical protein